MRFLSNRRGSNLRDVLFKKDAKVEQNIGWVSAKRKRRGKKAVR